jgi:N-acetylglucosaminyldiphosphoundecaprenol N-acetyl-beta-D-mannosaminyltransferase
MGDAVWLLGVRVDNVTEEEALARIEACLAEGGPHQVVTVNPEFTVLARDNAAFREVLNRAHLALADGVGLIWASRLLGQPLRARLPGVDMVVRICERAAAQGYRVFFLGGGAGVAAAAAEQLQRRCPGLQVAGCYAGSPREEEAVEIIGRIRAAGPQVLFVAFGAPAQDLWIARYGHDLGVPVMMGVGGSFDYLSGRVPRAPLWMRRAGLEWLFRLIRQPWRVRRQLTRLPRFVVLVLWEALRARRGPRALHVSGSGGP